MTRRGIDLSVLSGAERSIGWLAAAGFANGFVPWWYRIETPGRTYWANAGLTGWSIVAVAAAGLCLLVVVARAARWPRPAPRADSGLYFALAVIAGLALGRRAPGPWIGGWVASACNYGIALGALQRERERRRGWT